MKAITSTITAGCLTLLVGGTCLAAQPEVGSPSAVEGQQVATVGAAQNKSNTDLRAWLDTIKPAAGQVKAEAVQKRTEYWQQSVRRENRGHQH